ncbi:Glutathionylspermidine synthase preATP-grasp [uncultured archaeon]|nr:Glutathionylspermidine synthase preATP-grasp [uncultured archaeon]
MERKTFTPRENWQKTVESQGLTFHSNDNPYWNESVGYRFTAREVDTLEKAANDVHELCLGAAQHIIDKDLFHKLSIPDNAARLIVDSWNKDQLHLYGRFDFVYDGTGQPKMLEYNADTPTSLLEASVVQWHWMKDRFPYLDQFNSIHERLVDRWKKLGLKPGSKVHVSTLDGIEEDVITTAYLGDTAREAGFDGRFIGLESLGYDSSRRIFCDMDNEKVETLFKLYPWELIVQEDFAKHLPTADMRIVEPAWKMLWSNKGLLPILWELNPDHPNLLPSYETPEKLGNTWVKKPLFGREGANVTIRKGGESVETEGHYGPEGFIYQAYCQIPNFDGNYPVLGLWMVGDDCAGMGIRENSTEITDNWSRFTPHYIQY